MISTREVIWGALFAAAAFGVMPAGAADDGASFSRQMQLGIQFFERREDAQAMDRFMEILTKGDPSERPLANEYINLITHRMNTGEKLSAPARPKAPAPEAPKPAASPEADAPKASKRPDKPAKAPQAPEVVVEPVDDVAAPVRAAAALPSKSAAPEPEDERPEPPRAPAVKPDKAVMGREIKAKIKALMDKSLKDLKAAGGIKVLMRENGEPQAVAIPSAALFQSGISFQKTAGSILDALTGLAYSLSGAQIIVLPEGTSVNDAKVLDMRRTMGVSAQLFSGGIAPARVRVNLLSAQVEIPRPLQDFRGIVVLFVYNQPIGLVVESSVGDESGPPISLGVFPESIRPDKAEGSIIEFSVQDPPAGLVSWSFKMLQPSVADGGDLTPLQEVMGGGPVYHQIYWNGRQNYFGAVLASGRYECVLTATDAKNRQKTLHRWIHLLAEAPAPVPAGGVKAPAAAAKLGAPLAELPQEAAKQAPALIKEGASRKAKKKRRAAMKAKGKTPRLKSAAEQDAAEAPAPAAANAQAGPFDIAFASGKGDLSPEAEKALASAVDTSAYYPMQSIEIVGYAQASEAQAAALADQRAQTVAGILINKYKIDPKKVRVQPSVPGGTASKVQVRLGGAAARP